MGIIIAAAVVVLLALWGISCQRRLAVLDENVGSAMTQVGVQLSSRLDALAALLELTKGYDAHESQLLLETIRSHRGVITAASTPEEVAKQEEIIRETLDRVCAIIQRYPELKSDEGYRRCAAAVDSHERMTGTSRLIYNDSVTKLDRELRTFPTSLLAGVFGFRQREHLEAAEDRRELPGAE